MLIILPAFSRTEYAPSPADYATPATTVGPGRMTNRGYMEAPLVRVGLPDAAPSRPSFFEQLFGGPSTSTSADVVRSFQDSYSQAFHGSSFQVPGNVAATSCLPWANAIGGRTTDAPSAALAPSHSERY